MARTLCDSGLLGRSDRTRAYFTSAAGRLALTAKPEVRAWSFSAPSLETVRDVRPLRQCEVCARLGQDLPNHKGTTAHGACLVKRHGWPAIVEIDDQQLSRFRVEDFVLLGVTLANVEAARGAGRRIGKEIGEV